MPSAAPTATMATTAINPVNRPCTRRGHQNAVQVANPTSTATSNVMSLRGARSTRHQTWLTVSHPGRAQ